MNPEDVAHGDIVWSTDSSDIIYLSGKGYVRCIGNGTATVRATVKNPDGTYTTGVISINCRLNVFETILASMFKYIFIFNDYIESTYMV